MKVLRIGSMLATLLFLAACVTINIYFPAAQAEEAAERIVDDILGKQKQQEEQNKDEKKSSSLNQSLFQTIASGTLEFLIPSAQAAQPDFNASSPAIRKLQASMKSRNSALTPHYNSGAVGFTRDAMIAVHDAGAIPLKDRNKVQGLISSENSDRSALYRAIADANGHPEWEPEIRATFARTWVEKASRGWWYQNASGGWVQK
ncbi:YdbL family protein [Sedimenticola selenatireducens]|uniref:YdbL family protein n=1 Tax=Sedimenticola selenatireducens TaxID=191960 RepID=UPI00048F0A7D|nr:YdbL family protein [Sedimenticola selenatireducens]